MNMNIAADPIRKSKQSDTEVYSLEKCKEAVAYWNDARWNVRNVIQHLNEGWTFRISREIFNHIDIQSEALRGYLGIFDDTLSLILLDTTLDQQIYNGTVTDANLYAAPYIKMGLGVNDLVKGNGNLYLKMRRWIKSYPEYVETVIKQSKKSNLTGLVRLFEINTSDIVNEFKDECLFVLGFPGIKTGNREDGIDLIFMGIDPQGKPLHKFQLSPDDFTTPRPPFGTTSDYGLL